MKATKMCACNDYKNSVGAVDRKDSEARFWLRVMDELMARPIENLLLAVIDGLKGSPEPITTVYPDCEVPTYIVHLNRHLLQFASRNQRISLTSALKVICDSINAELPELYRFEAGSNGEHYAAMEHSWCQRWEEIVPFFPFSPRVRKILYAANVIEGLHS